MGARYREYAYITNGKSNTVTVIDLRTFQPVRTFDSGSGADWSCRQSKT